MVGFRAAFSALACVLLANTVLAGCEIDYGEEGANTEDGGISKVASIIVLVVYGIEWFVLLFPNIVPLARPASSMLGACICLVITEIATHFGSEAFDAFCYIDYDTLALLFGLMLIVVMIDDSGILLMIEMSLESKQRWWFLTKCCFVCAVLSAIVMNDTICLFFTAPILDACRKNPDVNDPLPYLLALSSNSNIGSALTVVGNPQNAMIGSIEHTITYANFLISMAIPCVMAWFINWAILLIWYRHSLGMCGAEAPPPPDLGNYGNADKTNEPIDDAENGHGETPAEKDGDDWQVLTEAEKKARKDTVAAGSVYKLFLCVGIVMMIIGFFVGIDVAGIATGFGIVFMCVRTVHSSRKKAKRHNYDLVDKESEKFLMQVDWPLLVLFTGLFIMISCTVQTGYPDDFFRATFNACKEDPTHDCTWLFAFMIVLFSNIISNVPLILLIKGYIVNSMTPGYIARSNWFFISWVCTLAGNFILLGSAANLIVADQARKWHQGTDVLTTIRHGKFGIPSTFLATVAGIPVLLKTMI